MPRRRVRRTKQEEKLSQEMRELQKEIRLSKRKKADTKPNKIDMSPALYRLKGRLGKGKDDVFEVALNRYAPDVITRIAKSWEKVRAESKRKELERKARHVVRLRLAGATPDKIKRYLSAPARVYKVRKVQFAPIMFGKAKGKIEMIEHGERVKVVGRRKAKKLEWYYRRDARITNIAQSLHITKKEAREILSEAISRAKKDLAATKSGKRPAFWDRKNKKFIWYKDLKARARRGFTEKRWIRGTLAGLYGLADVENYL